MTGSALSLAGGPEPPFAPVDEQTDSVSVQSSCPLVPCAGAEAVAEMPIEEPELNRLDRPPHRIRLQEEARTRLIAREHPAKALQMALDEIEAPQDLGSDGLFHRGQLPLAPAVGSTVLYPADSISSPRAATSIWLPSYST